MFNVRNYFFVTVILVNSVSFKCLAPKPWWPGSKWWGKRSVFVVMMICDVLPSWESKHLINMITTLCWAQTRFVPLTPDWSILACWLSRFPWFFRTFLLIGLILSLVLDGFPSSPLFAIAPSVINKWCVHVPRSPTSLCVHTLVASASSLRLTLSDIYSSRGQARTHARTRTHTHSSSRGAAAAAAAAALPCFYVCAGSVPTEVVNMAADGMVLTNHDHQTRVGILTGKAAFLRWNRTESRCESCARVVLTPLSRCEPFSVPRLAAGAAPC